MAQTLNGEIKEMLLSEEDNDASVSLKKEKGGYTATYTTKMRSGSAWFSDESKARDWLAKRNISIVKMVNEDMFDDFDQTFLGTHEEPLKALANFSGTDTEALQLLLDMGLDAEEADEVYNFWSMHKDEVASRTMTEATDSPIIDQYNEMFKRFKTGQISTEEWRTYCTFVLERLMNKNKDVFARLKMR